MVFCGAADTTDVIGSSLDPQPAKNRTAMSSGFTDLIIIRTILSSELSVRLWLLEHGPRTGPPVEHAHSCDLPMPHAWPLTGEQTFCRREQLLKATTRFCTIVPTIENRDLKADFRAISTLRRIDDAMHRRFGVLAGFQKI